MKRYKIILFLAIFLISCAQIPRKRELNVIIPTHPWEIENSTKLWYSLVWTESGKLQKMYVSPETREVRISVASDRTVIICAYPLDDLRPFGFAVDPLYGKHTVTLDQNNGVLADIIINGALEVADSINFQNLSFRCSEVCDDFRYIEESNLLADILNGQLADSSVKKMNGFTLENIEVYDGTWIGESVFDVYLDPAEINLPVGVHKFYNPQRNMVMSLGINNDGSYSKYEERALLVQR